MQHWNLWDGSMGRMCRQSPSWRSITEKDRKQQGGKYTPISICPILPPIPPKITRDIEQDLDEHYGLLEVEGEQAKKYILMSMDVYQQTMGVGSDEELQASIAALQAGMKDVQAGRTRPLTEALDDLNLADDVLR